MALCSAAVKCKEARALRKRTCSQTKRDFPSPREIRTYAGDSDEEYEMKEENSYPLQKGTISSEQDQEKFVSLLTLQKEDPSASAPHIKEDSAPAKEYSNGEQARNFKSRQGGTRSTTNPPKKP